MFLRPVSPAICSWKTSAVRVTLVLLLSMLLALKGCLAEGDIENGIENDCNREAIDASTTCLVDRSAVGPVKVVVHGTKNDPFWQQVKAGMEQTARDTQVDLELVLIDDEDPTIDGSTVADAMAQDILAAAGTSNHQRERQRQRQRQRKALATTGIVQGRNVHDSPPQSLRCGFGGCQSRMEDGELSSLAPSAVIVSLPGDPKIEDALSSLKSSNIPIFGINALYNNNNGDDTEGTPPFVLRGSVSMNETKAGIVAGTQIRMLLLASEPPKKNREGFTTGLYINHRPDVRALTERFEALAAVTHEMVDSWETFHMQKDTTPEEVAALLEGCRHTVIQLGSSGIAEAILHALVVNGCNIEADHVVGTFDAGPSEFVYDAMVEGTIDFAVSQQPYLQGSQALLLAALHATTGKSPMDDGASSSSSSSFSSSIETGPILITRENEHFPPKEQQACESEGFPVCSSDDGGSSFSSACPCTDRSRLSITVLTHDESSPFWRTVFSGIKQAATDFGVSIQKNPFKKAVLNQRRQRQHGEQANLRLKHTFDISEACQSRATKGLIASLPDASMRDGLLGCKSRGIPYLAINAMAGIASNDDGDGEIDADDNDTPSPSVLQYVGQKDYESGLEAGRRLIEAGVTKGCCLVHADFDTLNDRCHGMKEAFDEHEGSEFLGTVQVPNNGDVEMYKTMVERALDPDNTGSDWKGYGVLSTGREQIPSLLSLLKDHSELLAGTFDLDAALYNEGDDSGFLRDQIIFGIDQNAYMEGYLSVASMVWRLSTSEASTSSILETGPTFVLPMDASSSDNKNDDEQQQHQCRDKSIEFCRSKPKEVPFPPVEDPPPVEQRPLAYTGKCKNLDRKCGVCEGDCDDDTQCGEGLVCFVRDSLTSGVSDRVPGCSTNPIEWSAKDFCVDARLYECKDVESFDVRVGDFTMKRNCGYVAVDTRRCTEYGRLCRETCGYCRRTPRAGDATSY